MQEMHPGDVVTLRSEPRNAGFYPDDIRCLSEAKSLGRVTYTVLSVIRLTHDVSYDYRIKLLCHNGMIAEAWAKSFKKV